MRENRTYGLMRGKGDTTHGMRLFSHERGNPDTEVCRTLNSVSSFSTLPTDELGQEIYISTDNGETWRTRLF